MGRTDAISAAEVRHVARLCRLALTDEELEAYRDRLAAVLEYVRRLGEVDVRGVEPMPHVGDETNRVDEDVPGPMLPIEVVLRLAPETMGEFIAVPKVLEGAEAT